MKVSVIVPVYNTEAYLEQCLDALVHQTLGDLEILLVDDGSTDRCPQILDRYAEKFPDRVRVFHKENGGQASARNLGLQHATGEYLGFADSDDWADRNLFETMLTAAEKEQADLVVCDMVDHYPDGFTVVHPFSLEDRAVFLRSGSAVTKLFRRDLVEHLTFPEGLWYEDLEYTMSALFTAKHIAYCPDVAFHCRCRTDNGSTMFNQNSLKNLDIISVVDGLTNFLQENGILQAHQEDMTFIAIDHILISAINRVSLQNHPQREQVIQKLRTYVKTQFPNWKQSQAYRAMPRNRKIVASLNAAGLHHLSRKLLQWKGSRPAH